jgi:hypothetical protein
MELWHSSKLIDTKTYIVLIDKNSFFKDFLDNLMKDLHNDGMKINLHLYKASYWRLDITNIIVDKELWFNYSFYPSKLGKELFWVLQSKDNSISLLDFLNDMFCDYNGFKKLNENDVTTDRIFYTKTKTS